MHVRVRLLDCNTSFPLEARPAITGQEEPPCRSSPQVRGDNGRQEAKRLTPTEPSKSVWQNKPLQQFNTEST
jgi:hypothetical protein